LVPSPISQHPTPPHIYTLSLHDALPISGLAHERQAQPVLVRPGRLADEHQIRVRVACPEYDSCSRLVQRAAGAVAGLVVNRLQRSEEHTSELQSLAYLVCRLLLEKKKHT